MKRTSNFKTGNEYDYYNKEILNEDKPLDLSIEKHKTSNNSKFNLTPMKNSNSISIKNSEKRMSNTDFNNLRFEAEPLENKKLLRKSSTTNSIDMRGGSFNNNNNNLNNISELKSTVNNLNSITNNYQSSELEQFSPIKSSNRTPDKGN